MNSISTNPLKGMIDYPPALQWEYNYLKKIIDETAYLMGYEEYDVPILESMDTFAIKSSDEILREQSYLFTDRGGREVILRPEITPSLARLVSKEFKQSTPPLRWYIIGRCYRYERPQKGRLREFHQLNFDLLGESHLVYDLEIFKVIFKLMNNFKVTNNQYVIFYNHRGFVDILLDEIKFSDDEKKEFFHWVDRRNKMSAEEFTSQIKAIWNEPSKIEFIQSYLSETNPRNLWETINHTTSQAVDKDKLKQVNDFLTLSDQLTQLAEQSGSQKLVQYNPTVVRGFDYYTGVVFEVFSKVGDINRSLFGGGRYDRLTANYLKEPVSGIGFGMGLYIFSLFLKEMGVFPEFENLKPGYYIAPMDESVINYCQQVSHHLEGEGKLVVMHPPNSVKKHFQTAEKLGYRQVVLVGEDEMKEGIYTIKNLETSEQVKVKF